MIQTSLQIDEPGFMVGSVYTLCHSFNCPGLGRAVRWSFISEQTAFSTNITPSSPYPLPSSSSPTPSKRLTKVHNEFKRDLLLREVVLSPGEDLIGKSVCAQYPGHSELMHCQQTEGFCT
ncbi:hypothetical protein CesoFtcFv8_010826 [Champsocephalus esox]|uniref:Uncharacterized protein n=1 Tax=Champsocephalus esox TaxID=159716 RepID=A0AAN8C2X0_9TELE|nr:hypothetical protein CesoFtcFv8_010826 [Champsocephalus esox]